MNISTTAPVCSWRNAGVATRRVRFQFCFPPLYGIYDTGDGTIYVFGDHDGHIEDILSHEVLHWAVQKTAGKQASLDLDGVPADWLRA
jgi:hypothetical protein